MTTRPDTLWKLPWRIWTYATSKRLTWLEQDRLAACRYPRDDKALMELAERGVDVLVNLHGRPHSPQALVRRGMTEVHLPVPDFTAPTQKQLVDGIAAIEQALADGRTVAVHCGAGLGRTGTLLACYLIKRGLAADEALARIRAVRPGSVETCQQERAVEHYAQCTTSARDYG